MSSEEFVALIDTKLALQATRWSHRFQELKFWVLLFTAPAWGDFAQDWGNRRIDEVVTMVCVVIALAGIAYWRKKHNSHGDDDE